MFPSFQIFGLTIYMYSIMMALGLIGAILLFKYVCYADGVDDKTYNFYSILAIVSIISGLFFAALYQAFYDFLQNPSNGFKWTGLTFMGGLIGGVACFVIGTALFAPKVAKTQFYSIINKAILSVPLAHALGRIGCFFSGCCYGIHSGTIFDVNFPYYGEHLPTQLYEAVFLAVLFAFLMLTRHKLGDRSFILYFYIYPVFRFMLEFIRDDSRGAFLFGVISPSQVQSIIMILANIALTVYIYIIAPKLGKSISGFTPQIVQLQSPISKPDNPIITIDDIDHPTNTDTNDINNHTDTQ